MSCGKNRWRCTNRRQVPFKPCVADFASHQARLVVELDGAQHAEDEARRHDDVRTVFLEEHGYRVMRFWNNEVFENLEGVCETILAATGYLVDPLTPTPLPRGERG